MIDVSAGNNLLVGGKVVVVVVVVVVVISPGDVVGADVTTVVPLYENFYIFNNPILLQKQ